MKETEQRALLDRHADPQSRILDCLTSICGTSDVRTNLDLPVYENQIMDSMKTVELILAIEEQFGLYISPAELDRQSWATPRKIVADIKGRLES
jgi:D-alanine--poly(phosphoribitol) ligase subunit 2